MSLEQAVHERWAAAGTLAALLPAAYVTTGLARGDSLPYATILRRQARSALRTNAGTTVEEVTMRINVWHDAHGAGRDIVDQVEAAFDGAGLVLSDPQRSAQMRKTGEQVSQHSDGIWQFVLEFLVYVYLPSSD